MTLSNYVLTLVIFGEVLLDESLADHSRLLESYSIATTVPNWSKVNGSLKKMYQAEVLEKHAAVQHFYFGDIQYCLAKTKDRRTCTYPYYRIRRAGG